MSQKKIGNIRFVHYFSPVLDALRALGGEARPREVFEWIKENLDIPQDEIDFIHTKSGQSKFENKVAWARFYLVKAGLVDNSKYGVWSLTEEGRRSHMDYPASYELFRQIQATFNENTEEEEIESFPAPVDKIEEEVADIDYRTDVPSLPFAPIYWFGGAMWGKDDQTENFLREGVWKNGWEDRYIDKVKAMRPGEKIAIKAAFTRKKNVPFDVGGLVVSVMRIKATGTIIENPGDGRIVKVAWDPVPEPRDWYFYTAQETLWGADPANDYSMRLILFAFKGVRQDYAYWLNQEYWADKYKYRTPSLDEILKDAPAEEEEALESAEPTYTVSSIKEDGSFMSEEDLFGILKRLEAKKNIILQGPPGTGKTWLAKRLGYALLGRKAQDRMKVVQFHPSLSYEDFVRGWRPAGDGKLALTDGAFLEAIKAAKSNPEPFVVVIEEINRGNPATIFGELLTLLESDKRSAAEGISLAYSNPHKKEERVYIPDNLYVIGTMNIADRSLALVDLALRRRFSFITLSPMFNEDWERWCVQHGQVEPEFIKEISRRVAQVNDNIAKDLGDQFRIGHSYFTPPVRIQGSGHNWFTGIVKTEIEPLLDEYFYDDGEKAAGLCRQLTEGLR